MSKYDDILTQVETDVEAIGLTGVTAPNIVRRKVASKRKNDLPALPGIVISSVGAVRVMPGGPNSHDDIGYPVMIAVIQSSNQDQSSDFEPFTNWLEQIRRTFINKHLTGVAGVWNCIIDPRDTFDPNAFFAGFDAGGMILRFISRETRL